MYCWRLDLSRNIVAYIHGDVSENQRKRIESHLETCEDCRDQLTGIVKTIELTKQLPPLKTPQNTWNAIESAITGENRVPARLSYWVKGLAGAAAAIFAVFVMFALGKGEPDLRKQETEIAFDPAAFHAISLSQFSESVEPHVATEGYVERMHVNEEDENGDLKFRLVDNLDHPNHFVVCEIIAPFKMQAPPPGSRIRVYGVSRYDGKAQHQWFEVHPVLNIEPIQ